MSGARKENVQQVKVYVRPRPLNEDECDHRCKNIIQRTCGRELYLKFGLIEKKYVFDGVFNEKTGQGDIYKCVVAPMINCIVAGYNCTVFAYGQTGTGKTHTMVGNVDCQSSDFKEDPGIGMIPRTAINLFDELTKLDSKVEYTVQLSFIEIYNEEVRDLLTTNNDTPLRIFEDPENKGSVCIKGMREVTVCSPREVFDCLISGTLQRQTASTKLNRNSSRSHTVFTLLVHTRETSLQNVEVTKTGKLHIVDLAGSENIGRSGASDMRAREAGTINKSLLTLGKVIKALSQKMQHVPYRDSKLTRILQDSLGGKTRTSMIATFTPSAVNWDETLSTLEYAHLARNVANCPQINESRKEANILNDLKEEMLNLKRELRAARDGEGFYMSHENYDELTEELERKKSEVIMSRLRQAELVQQLEQLEERSKQLKLTKEKIEHSFITTKDHLKQVRKQQKIENRTARQDKHVLEYLTQREAEVTDEAIRMRNICEAGSQREAIVYNKYENQCDNTLKNAQSARAIFALSSSFCGNLNERLESFGGQAEINFNEIQTNNDVVGRVSEKVLEVLKDCAMKLTAELQKERDFNSLVRIGQSTKRFGEEDIRMFFAHNRESVSQAHLAIESDAVNFEQDVATTFAKAGEKLDSRIEAEKKLLAGTRDFQTNCRDRAEDVLEMMRHLRRVFVDNEQQSIENQTKSLSDQTILLQDQLSEIQTELPFIESMLNHWRKRYEVLKRQKEKIEGKITEVTQNREELEQHKIRFVQNQQKITDIEEAVKRWANHAHAGYAASLAYLEEGPMDNARQLLGVCRTVSTQFPKTSLENARDVFSTTYDKLSKSVCDVLGRANEKHSELIDTIKRNVAADDDDTRIALKEVLDATDTVCANLSTTVAQNVASIHTNIQVTKSNYKNLIADIQSAARATVADGEKQLKENVVFQGHVGDTPARPMNRIPQRIVERLPTSVLLERFTEIDHDSSIDQSDVDVEETIPSPGLSNNSPEPGPSSGSGTHSSSFECLNENDLT